MYRLLLTVAVTCTVLGWSRPGATADLSGRNTVLPRYRLEVGQEIHYRGESDNQFKGGRIEFRNEWTIWVVRRNDDSSRRVVIRFKSSMRDNGKKWIARQPDLVCWDVLSDGRTVSNPSPNSGCDPAYLFPRLPASRKDIADGWQNTGERDEGCSSYKVVSPPANESGEWTFQQEIKGVLDVIRLRTHKRTLTFDPARGLFTKVREEHTEGWGFEGKETGTSELVSVEHRDPQWMKQLGEDVDRCLQAKRGYDEKTRQASRDNQSTRKLLDEAKALLIAARNATTIPVVKEQLDQELKRHDSVVEYTISNANSWANVLGHHAADWEARDLDGKPHSLKDYRGQVVILDFWYRGCGWCIRAMPQINELAADFRGQPLVVLGMNTDEKAADARFVADKMGLNYATLQVARDLPDKYAVSGFPTLVIIDQRGNVHDRHVGYSPTLRRDIAHIAREMLGPVTASTNADKTELRSGDTFQLAVEVEVAAGWHIYSIDRPAGVAVPTKIAFELPQGLEWDGKWISPDPSLDASSAGDPSFVHEGKVAFRRRVRVARGAPAGRLVLHGTLHYQTCGRFSCRAPAELPLQTAVRIVH
ncbi:MAG TPA: redoxin domain-containing protein [Planctomycetaceae bacterium]|jgi:thiol-disulfide isomerase/thioredoxin|nr:redoxin domain-containing protein [Planctomycetaceae bacterium]